MKPSPNPPGRRPSDIVFGIALALCAAILIGLILRTPSVRERRGEPVGLGQAKFAVIEPRGSR